MLVSMRLPQSYRPLLLSALLILNAVVWYAWFNPAEARLQVSVLDIGQGDSILVQGPTGLQMLVDGGPDRSVLRELPKEMSFFDRSIDLVVETHPDKDHIAGLTEVLDRYRVSYFMSPGIPHTTATVQGLKAAISRESELRAFTARRGMRIHLGGGAYADVLYPDHDVSHEETNEGSVVMRVVYGSTSFMLTGDAPSDVEDRLIGLDANRGELLTDVLKAGHHGSKYSTNDTWLSAVHPKYIAISAGKDNSYGHPSPEVLERIKKEGAKIFSTIDLGTLRFVSDGYSVSVPSYP